MSVPLFLDALQCFRESHAPGSAILRTEFGQEEVAVVRLLSGIYEPWTSEEDMVLFIKTVFFWFFLGICILFSIRAVVLIWMAIMGTDPVTAFYTGLTWTQCNRRYEVVFSFLLSFLCVGILLCIFAWGSIASFVSLYAPTGLNSHIHTILCFFNLAMVKGASFRQMSANTRGSLDNVSTFLICIFSFIQTTSWVSSGGEQVRNQKAGAIVFGICAFLDMLVVRRFGVRAYVLMRSAESRDLEHEKNQRISAARRVNIANALTSALMATGAGLMLTEPKDGEAPTWAHCGDTATPFYPSFVVLKFATYVVLMLTLFQDIMFSDTRFLFQKESELKYMVERLEGKRKEPRFNLMDITRDNPYMLMQGDESLLLYAQRKRILLTPPKHASAQEENVSEQAPLLQAQTPPPTPPPLPTSNPVPTTSGSPEEIALSMNSGSSCLIC